MTEGNKKIDDKIVYLIGAGASAEALPLVTEMQERMELMQFFVTEVFPLGLRGKILDDKFWKEYENFVSAHGRLVAQMKSRRSIDTYANELFLKNTKESIKNFVELKASMAAYLAFEEMWSDLMLFNILSKPLTRKMFTLDVDAPFSEIEQIKNARESYAKILNSLSNTSISSLKRTSDGETNSTIKSLDESLKDILTSQYQANSLKNISDFLRFWGKKTIDQRYINFLVDICERGGKDGDVIFPEKVRLFSWNYDSQIFKASDELNFLIEEDSILERFNGVASDKKSREKFSDVYDILVLLAGNYSDEEKKEKQKEFVKRTLAPLVKLYNSFLSEPSRQLSFAFEKDKYEAEALGQFKTEKHLGIGSVKTLVVLGYSFPFSNRSVDREFLRAIIKKNIQGNDIKSFDVCIYAPSDDAYKAARLRVKTILKSIYRHDNPELSRFKEGQDENKLLFLDNGGIERGEIRFFHYWDKNNFFIPQDL